LADDSVVEILQVERGARYRLKSSRQGGEARQGSLLQLRGGGDVCQGGGGDFVISLENRTLRKTAQKEESYQTRFGQSGQAREGSVSVQECAVRDPGVTDSYKPNGLYVVVDERGPGNDACLLPHEMAEREAALAV